MQLKSGNAQQSCCKNTDVKTMLLVRQKVANTFQRFVVKQRVLGLTVETHYSKFSNYTCASNFLCELFTHSVCLMGLSSALQ